MSAKNIRNLSSNTWKSSLPTRQTLLIHGISRHSRQISTALVVCPMLITHTPKSVLDLQKLLPLFVFGV